MLNLQALKPAKLVLEDGSIFNGFSFGKEKNIAGEVVFNTGMVGYELSLTDPSYKGQILTLTYPLIGNYGIPGKEKKHGMLRNFESENIQVTALIVSDYSFYYSHWNAKRSLSEWLVDENVPAITGVDTRSLTKKLREKGVMLGKIVIDKKGDALKFEDPNLRNLVAEASTDNVVKYGSGRKTTSSQVPR